LQGETRRHGGGDVGVKADIFPQRAPRTAGRAADAGGQYGKDKLTIGPGSRSQTACQRRSSVSATIGFITGSCCKCILSLCRSPQKKPAILLFNFSRRRGKCGTAATSRF
jgi:hypothetical protein